MTVKVETLRAVIEAARNVRHNVNEPPLLDLFAAVDALEAELPKKASGFVVKRKWAEVLIDDWVRAPNGEWYAVVDTPPWRIGNPLPVVIRIEGKELLVKRDPDGEVSVRKRSRPADPEADAMELLRQTFGAEVIGRE